MDLREKIACEVIQEYLDERQRVLDEERRKRVNELIADAQKKRHVLDERKYPLYESHPASLYVEKYGSKKIHPFRKCTKFSKPIHEQLDGTFKHE